MPLKPLFQNQTPFILLSPVFQRIFNSPGQNQQNGKRASASYHLNPSRLHLNPSGLIIRLYPLIFLQSLSALSLSIIFVELCIKTVYLTMTGEQFRICGVQVTEKYILLLKKLKVDILTHVPKAKPSHRFLSSSSM